MVQWLGPRAHTAEGPGSIPGRGAGAGGGTRILQVAGQKKKKTKTLYASWGQDCRPHVVGPLAPGQPLCPNMWSSAALGLTSFWREDLGGWGQSKEGCAEDPGTGLLASPSVK